LQFTCFGAQATVEMIGGVVCWHGLSFFFERSFPRPPNWLVDVSYVVPLDLSSRGLSADARGGRGRRCTE
jgi:hypothetical protein